MLRTNYRARLPKSLSYPIGAEAISEALLGAPHGEAFSLWFSDVPGRSALEFHRVLSERQPYRVVEARFEPARKPGLSAADFMVESGWYDEKWELTVYPVLREFRHLANGLIREIGLPAVARWLESSERAGWGGRSHQLVLRFGPAEGSLVVEEWSGV